MKDMAAMITGSSIIEKLSSGMAYFRAALAPFLFALIAVLAPTGAHSAALNVPGGYKTIQEAVNAAGSGDTVYVGDGTYRENVIISKPVTLQSRNGAGKTVITPSNKRYGIITINAVDGAAISGFTVKGSDVSGITLVNARHSRISGNNSSGNGIGISLDHSNGNVITENTTGGNEVYGIYLTYSSGNEMNANTSNRNADKGFFLSNSDDNRLRGNNANLNTWNGITIFASKKNQLKDNVTLRNTYGIVLSDAEDTLVEGNSSLPNIFLIIPVLLLYIGIVFYLIEKNIMRLIYR